MRTRVAQQEFHVVAGIAKFGRVDALLNNASYGAYGLLEATPPVRSIYVQNMTAFKSFLSSWAPFSGMVIISNPAIGTPSS